MDSSNMLNWNYPHHLLNGGEVVIHSNSGNEHLTDAPMLQDLGLQQHIMTLHHDLSGLDPLMSFGMFLPGGSNARISSFMHHPLLPSDHFTHASNFLRASPFFDDYGIQQHLQCVGPQMPASELGGLAVNKSSSSCSSSMDQLKISKRPRLESRPSISPFKVRKEKLGDRIAALQQLVAPFGKTDTASVLTEAVGYIKFLQDQVETLSVAYMGPSNNKKLRTTEEVSAEEIEEKKPNLRTRGLCLVPLSCTSYVTGDNVVWSPPNYR